MKKIVGILSAILVLATLVGCGEKKETYVKTQNDYTEEVTLYYKDDVVTKYIYIVELEYEEGMTKEQAKEELDEEGLFDDDLAGVKHKVSYENNSAVITIEVEFDKLEKDSFNEIRYFISFEMESYDDEVSFEDAENDLLATDFEKK